MRETFDRLLHLSVEQAGLLVAVLGLVGTLVTTLKLSARMRRLAGLGIRTFAYRAGIPSRKYGRWFVRKYASIENVYLDRVEALDLAATYVPLTVTSDSNPSDAELLGTDVMGANRGRKIIVLGDPGSGKSTLLRAYGAGITKRAWGAILLGGDWRPTKGEVPFLIPLRKLRAESGANAVEQYLLKLLIDAGITRRPEWCLRRLLKDGRCLVLLDGLDEVAEARYHSVLQAVGDFCEGENTELPTGLARVVLTCRRQNFLKIRDDWMPWFSDEFYMLAPFRDSDVQRYVAKRKSAFHSPKSPKTFLADLKASGNFDLHRSPLILAMSVGLYVRDPAFIIPSSIPVLYDAMISEMLRRRSADSSPVSQSLKFDAMDKRRLLRDIALKSAELSNHFESFSRRDLITHAEFLSPELTSVGRDQVDEFVEEIVTRAGLVFDASDDGLLSFTHRSIHEFLAAEAISRMEDGGINFISERASHDAWRQSLMFVVASAPQADELLIRIASVSPELAGHALASARVSKEVAAGVLATLGDRARQQGQVKIIVPAILAATRSPEPAISDTAVQLVREILLSNAEDEQTDGQVDQEKRLRALFGGDTFGALQVLDDVANSNSPQVAALSGELAGLVPNNARLVAPLWRSLNTPGIENEPACKAIISNLLTLAMKPDCFVELQSQETLGEREFSGRTLSEVYPFKRAVPLSSNFVKLLALADELSVEPLGPKPCPFFEAKRLDPKAFKNLERDNRYTVKVPIHVTQWFLTTLAIVGTLGAATWATYLLFVDFGRLTRPYGMNNAVLVLLSMAAPYMAHRFIRIERLPAPGSMQYELGCFSVVFAPLPPIAISVALLPIAASSVVLFLIAASVANFVFFFLPLARVAPLTHVFYIPALNPYRHVYSDPGCRHWVTKPQ
ncbi:NACHT domain-containing protein [Micromonospora costi]|uniref:NACHT domain-containing protein n=1 Tax=Micromonospora costi TaxID=1530042 RepID=A0A3B0A4M2_9ACTN|nr:NACHT domain-containing protein [Micromonospora costi]RKN55400.1 NACHT domain-containing protein [Micromonospora costi]